MREEEKGEINLCMGEGEGKVKDERLTEEYHEAGDDHGTVIQGVLRALCWPVQERSVLPGVLPSPSA